MRGIVPGTGNGAGITSFRLSPIFIRFSDNVYMEVRDPGTGTGAVRSRLGGAVRSRLDRTYRHQFSHVNVSSETSRLGALANKRFQLFMNSPEERFSCTSYGKQKVSIMHDHTDEKFFVSCKQNEINDPGGFGVGAGIYNLHVNTPLHT